MPSISAKDDDLKEAEEIKQQETTSQEIAVQSTVIETKKPSRQLTELEQDIFGDDDFSLFDAAIDDNIDQSDLKISRLAIMQPGSPEIAASVPGYEIGQIIDNVTRQVYSVKEKAPWLLRVPGIDPANVPSTYFTRIVVIAILPKEYVRWKDRNTEGKGMHFKSLDRHEERVRAGLWPNRGGTWVAKEGEKNKPPITENINVLCAVINPDWTLKSPFLVDTFARSSFPAGKFLVNAVGRHKLQRLPPWGMFYYQKTERGPNKDYNYLINKIVPGETMKEKPEYKDNARQLHEICKEMAIKLSDCTKCKDDPEGRTNGRVLQELYINSATLIEDEGEDADIDSDVDDNNTVDSNEPAF